MEDFFKILLVDDDEIVHELVKMYLNEKRFEISDAYDGSDAVDMAFNNIYDLILMDIRMPHSGITATKTIKSMSPNIDIICISSYETEYCKDIDLFDDFIRKPFTKNVFRNKIFSFLKIEE